MVWIHATVLRTLDYLYEPSAMDPHGWLSIGLKVGTLGLDGLLFVLLCCPRDALAWIGLQVGHERFCQAVGRKGNCPGTGEFVDSVDPFAVAVLLVYAHGQEDCQTSNGGWEESEERRMIDDY